MAELYKLTTDDRGVAFVTLNRPDIHNAFNAELIQSLTKLFIDLEKNDSLRLVLLTGEGKSFCAGADLNWMKQMKNYSDDENYQDSLALAKMFQVINNFSKPVLGRVNGAALGGGLGLVSVCDYVLAVKSAKFGFTEVQLGLIPAVISPFVIAKIGESNARAYFLSGERFSTQLAYEIGLVHQICPLDDLDTSTERLIDKFLKAGPKAAVKAKSLVKNILELPADQITDYTCKAISKARVETEGQEGMTALLEKRAPRWQGK
jgi:methylglutaconyl-CoA hydratase